MLELKTGDKIGGFVVKERIGKGGMGEVFLVQDPHLGVDRALKVIALKREADGRQLNTRETLEFRERFLREARTLARLRHPHIITVHTVGEHVPHGRGAGKDAEKERHPFLVMTHFASKDARRWLDDDQPQLDEVKLIAQQLAGALAYAHGQGVLHRDIKLGNILIQTEEMRDGLRDAQLDARLEGDLDPRRTERDEPGDVPRGVLRGKLDPEAAFACAVAGDDSSCPRAEAMLIDFGLAKSASDSDLTSTGRNIGGTYSYMAPEYVAANVACQKARHSELTDLWALGCVLYGLTCHRLPFEGVNDLMLFPKILAGDFPSAASIRCDASAEWTTLLADLMHMDPKKRIPSARALLTRLASIDSPHDLSKPVFVPPDDRDNDAADEAADVAEDGDVIRDGPKDVALGQDIFAEQPNDVGAPNPRASDDHVPARTIVDRPGVFGEDAFAEVLAKREAIADAIWLPPLDGVEGIVPPASRELAVDEARKEKPIALVQAALVQAALVQAALNGAAKSSERVAADHVVLTNAGDDVAVLIGGTLNEGAIAVDSKRAQVASSQHEGRVSSTSVPSASSVSFTSQSRSGQQEVERAFRAPAPKTPSTRSSAMRRLALPVVAAALVLAAGSSLVLLTGSARAGTRPSSGSSFVDPDELRRRGRSDEELKDIEREKQARALPIIVAPVPLPSASSTSASSTSASSSLSSGSAASTWLTASSARAKSREPSAAQLGSRPRAAPPSRTAPSGPADAFALRYGSRVDFNTPSGPPVAVGASGGDDGTGAKAASAGIKVPVRVVLPIASSPTGPVIALVTQQTTVGTLTLPSGAELHGQTSGTSGSRVLVTFSFAIIDGRNVPLRGTALGLDGRAGVAGTKSLGGASDIVGGGAAGGASGVVDALANAVDDSIVGGAVRGAGSPGTQKLGRINNEEDIVLTGRGARFFVYVGG